MKPAAAEPASRNPERPRSSILWPTGRCTAWHTATSAITTPWSSITRLPQDRALGSDGMSSAARNAYRERPLPGLKPHTSPNAMVFGRVIVRRNRTFGLLCRWGLSTVAKVLRVKIRCPETQQVFDTGIRTSGREALSNNAYQEGLINCRFCNQFHSLDEDAFFEVEQTQQANGLWRPNP